ncbi:MAG: hypothetical protein IKO81_04990, partial [Bacteroidales bacterium]|nr:hypothetical protein [Bacteroidales bacterium]
MTESGFDKLYIYDGESTSGTLLGTYSGTLSPFSVISSAGALTFVFHSDGSVQKPGWEATISCEDCSLPHPTEPDYNMHHGKDTIHCSDEPRPFYDPGGFGGNYENNSDYIQTFVSSDPTKCLTVTFTSFATEWYLDKLYVYDGTAASGTILGVYSGYLDPFTLTSFTGTLTFVFHSDGTSNEEGWAAVISCSDCAEPPEPSNDMHYGTDTIYCSQAPRPFYDPGGPDGDYEFLSDYIQTFVSSDPDSCLQVTFTIIEMEDGFDVLYVYDGYSTYSTLVATLTGSMSNVTITSSTGALTFQFFSYYSAVGWEAVISCSGCAVPPTPPPPPGPDPCAANGIHPFCTDENPYGITYSSGTSGENASSFLGSSQYSCLYTTPNPAWYYMQISDPGDLLLYIEQVSTAGSGLDVDFVCWGPFSATSQSDFTSKLCNGEYTLNDITHGSHRPTNGNHQGDMGDYPDGNVVDCSYSAQSTEWCFIPDAQQGEWYLFLITNYSGQTGTISFSVVDSLSSATTNCNLLTSVSSNEPLCDGDTLVLTCEEPLSGATYYWSGPGGWMATTTVPYVTIPNVNAGQSGQYSLQITVTGSTVIPADVYVTIHEKPQVVVTASADTVCEGTSVILQAVGAANYEWLPAVGTGSSITVTPENTTNYKVIGTTNGCRDTVVHQVTVLQNSTGDTNAVTCGSFDWYEHIGLTGSGSYQHTFTNAAGCDSVVTLHLTAAGLPAISINTLQNVICEGSSVTLNATTGEGLSYLWNTGDSTAIITVSPEQTIEYSVTVTNNYGCNDSVSLTITVEAISEQTLYDTVCRGEAYEGYGFTLTAAETSIPGTHTLIHTDTVGPGCVSSTTLLLTIQNPTHLSFTEVACESFTWHDTEYTQSDDYTYSHTDANGCTQVDTLHLTIHNPIHHAITIAECGSYTWTDGNGQTYTSSGDYTYVHEDANECTQVDTLHLTIHNPTNLAFTETACESYTWNGTTYTSSGDYTYVHEDANGCTQVDTLHLTIHNPTNLGYTETAYDSYTWTDGTGETYSQSGTYYYSRTDGNGCTQVDTLYLTVYYSSSDEFSATSCESYDWDGETYTQSGDYTREYQDIHGADSTVTLHLTIHYGTHNTESLSVCEDYTWHGTTYTESGTYIYEYTNTDNCPSVDTLHLTVFHPVHTAFTETSCGNFAWNGTVYTQSGDYTYSHLDANGCTQVDTLHLTINHATSQDIYDAVCLHDEYDDYGFYITSEETGTAGAVIERTHHDMGSNECDSVTVLHLTVKDTVLHHIYDEVCFDYDYDNYGFFVSSEE